MHAGLTPWPAGITRYFYVIPEFLSDAATDVSAEFSSNDEPGPPFLGPWRAQDQEEE
jgi:hypothetical protein